MIKIHFVPCLLHLSLTGVKPESFNGLLQTNSGLHFGATLLSAESMLCPICGVWLALGHTGNGPKVVGDPESGSGWHPEAPEDKAPGKHPSASALPFTDSFIRPQTAEPMLCQLFAGAGTMTQRLTQCLFVCLSVSGLSEFLVQQGRPQENTHVGLGLSLQTGSGVA